MRHPLRLIATAFCAVLLVGACGDDDEDADPQIEAGGCVFEDDDSIKPVLCDSEAAEDVLVHRIDAAPQYRCQDGLTKLVFNQVLNGQSTGIDFAWCVGMPGELTPAQQERLDRQKADDEDRGNP